MATPTKDDASLSITSNLQKLNSGNYCILTLFMYGPSSSIYNQDQLLDSFTEARDTLHADDTTHTGNPKDVDGITSHIDIGKQDGKINKNGRLETTFWLC